MKKITLFAGILLLIFAALAGRRAGRLSGPDTWPGGGG